MDYEARALYIRIILNSVSSHEDLDMEGSPQNLAMNWIISEDTRYLCPYDPTLIPRYSLAVFYYSTRGNRWTQCSAPDNFTDPVSIAAANENCNLEPVPDSGSDAWLGPKSECAWGGVVCNDAASVDQISLGKADKRFENE
jgi:hypothetical protein